VKALLGLCRLIDAVNERVGKTVYWLVLAAVLLCTVNALFRYSFDVLSKSGVRLQWYLETATAWLELQWYFFAAIFLLCAGYTLLRNEHIRIDVIYGKYSKRTQTWVDLVGGVLFLLPISGIIGWLGYKYLFLQAWEHNEVSANSPLMLWPVKILVPIGFLLLALQGVSEIIKRAAFLMGKGPDPAARKSAHGVEPEHV
jgi:TRAP-type mannitol/chloroaromatic compound transport system permease small subunit